MLTSARQVRGSAVRWVARAWSIATILLVLAFIIGEGGPSRWFEWLGFLFFPFGICVGMMVAWWKEVLGGSITVLSLLAFYLVHLATAGTLPKGPWFVLFSAPGLLFLLAAWLCARLETAAP